MSAIFPKNGKMRQLDRRPEPDEPVTDKDVQDPKYLARLLFRMLQELARLKRRWWPKHFDYEEQEVDATGTTKHRFVHGLNQRVRWWPVEWKDATGGPQLVQHVDTDDHTLVLVSYTAGTLTLRVEEAG